MKLETMMNAMLAAYEMRYGIQRQKRWRQYQTFRAGIIRRDVKRWHDAYSKGMEDGQDILEELIKDGKYHIESSGG